MYNSNVVEATLQLLKNKLKKMREETGRRSPFSIFSNSFLDIKPKSSFISANLVVHFHFDPKYWARTLPIGMYHHVLFKVDDPFGPIKSKIAGSRLKI